MPESGITLEHFEAAASLDASLRSFYLSTAIDGLRITAPGDKLAFISASIALWQQIAADADF